MNSKLIKKGYVYITLRLIKIEYDEIIISLEILFVILTLPDVFKFLIRLTIPP